MSVPDDEAAELANDLAIANAQVKWMEAENERLRAALRPFVDARMVDATMRENARRALKVGIRSSV